MTTQMMQGEERHKPTLIEDRTKVKNLALLRLLAKGFIWLGAVACGAHLLVAVPSVSSFTNLRCYEVIALEPNPAAESRDISHPHVRNQLLCEGDGQEAIRRALFSGRLSDFFQIVTQILNTYNGGSAYASLSEWEGTACEDCGRFVSEDDRSFCERCDRGLCLDCLECCGGCEARLCSCCTEQCESCDARLCRSCRRSCDQCGSVHCVNCLFDNDLCGECQEQENDEDTLDQNEESTVELATAVAPPAGESSSATESDANTV
jgi:hypothetical protein